MFVFPDPDTPDEPSFLDLYAQGTPPPAQPVATAVIAPVTPIVPDIESPSSLFARTKLATSLLTPETFPMKYGPPGRYGGLPYFTITFKDSPTGYTIDRIDREENKYNYPAGVPVELYFPNGKQTQARFASEAYTAVAEGQIKAYAAEKYIGLPTPGINGCYGWGEKLRTVSKTVSHTTVKSALLAGLGQGRYQLVLFDGDWAKNLDVERALGTYCTEVARTGTEPIVPDFGYGPNGERLAVDDWLFIEFAKGMPPPDVVLRRVLALPRVPWKQLQVQGSFYSSDIERFNRGYIDFTDRGNATFLLRIYGPGNLLYLTDARAWACFGDELDGDDPEIKKSKTWKLYPEKALELVNPAALQRKHHAERLYQTVHELTESNKLGFSKPVNSDLIASLEKEALALYKSYITLSENPTRQAVLTDLMTRDDVRALRGDFDSRVDILNTPDGIVELETGVVRPARRDDFVLLSTAVGYTGVDPTEHVDPVIAADAIKMRQGLIEALSVEHKKPDPEMVRYHCRRMGASLRAECSLTALEIFHGEGGTAKSSIMTVALAALGSYGVVVPAGVVLNAFQNRDPEAATPFAIMLVGKRIAFISETKDTAVLDDAKLKMLSGGDVLAMRGNYRDGANYKSTSTIILLTNNIPSCRALDKALADRLAITPFRCRWNRPDKLIMSAGDDDLPAADKWYINEARSSIGARMWLLWAYVQGGVQYSSEVLDADGKLLKAKHVIGIRPPAVIDAVATYITEQDEISQFLSESQFRLHTGGDGDRNDRKVLSGLVYTAYSEFIRARGGLPPNSSTFSKRLKDRCPQVEITRIGGKSFMLGVVLKSEEELKAERVADLNLIPKPKPGPAQ